jgi:hypothetical protein
MGTEPAPFVVDRIVTRGQPISTQCMVQKCTRWGECCSSGRALPSKRNSLSSSPTIEREKERKKLLAEGQWLMLVNHSYWGG